MNLMTMIRTLKVHRPCGVEHFQVLPLALQKTIITHVEAKSRYEHFLEHLTHRPLAILLVLFNTIPNI